MAWDFGDGTPLVTTSTPTVAHTYQKPGTYSVTVGVYGQLGDGGVTTVKVTVVGAPKAVAVPGASAGPNWLLIGGVALMALLLLAAAIFFWLDHRKRAEEERRRIRAAELARARRVNGAPQRSRLPSGQRDMRDARDMSETRELRRDGPPRRERQPYPTRLRRPPPLNIADSDSPISRKMVVTRATWRWAPRGVYCGATARPNRGEQTHEWRRRGDPARCGG